MGGEQQRKIARGVTVRQFQSGREVYQVQFTFRGVSCKEIVKMPITKTNNRYITNLRAEIDNAIARNVFNYLDYFPESTKAALFGHAVSTETVSDLLESWISDIERSHPHSTHRAYSKLENCASLIYLKTPSL